MSENLKLTFADIEPVGLGTPAGTYLRLFWHPVFRARDLLPGQMKPIEILGEKFTLYRGQDGSPHVVAPRCAHRGTPLSIGWVEGDTVRCRYHGWRFDSQGNCVEQPNEDRPFCEKVKIRSYPTREYVGLIFAYLGEGEPPEFRRYRDLEQPGVIVADPVEVLPCTFWNRIDNEPNHIPWTHRATAFAKNRPDLLTYKKRKVEEASWGVKITILEDNGKETDSFNCFFMPNVRRFWPLTRAKGYEHRKFRDTKTVWIVPINDHKHACFDVTHSPLEGDDARAYARDRYLEQETEAVTRWDLAEKALSGEMTLKELPSDLGAYTRFAIEDYTTQVGQGSIAERGEELLAQGDALTVLLRRLWLREVGALLQGKPLTQWSIPETLRKVPVPS